MKKVLIITYYWPPSGGAGVQRWVKFTKYLSKLGVKTYVLTVDPKYATYPQMDKSLSNDVPRSVKVFYSKSFELYSFYKKVSTNKEVPYGGFANAKTLNLKEKILRFVRGNFFIPDPRRGWNKFAYKKAKEIIPKYNIDTVITTSPPHSTQLIGLKLKKNLKIKWVADFRDPWTEIYYFKQMYPTAIAKQIHLNMERKILAAADKIITVSDDLRRLFKEKIKNDLDKIHVIQNGFDPDDFAIHGNIANKQDDAFYVSYIGTISNDYNIEGFAKAISQLPEKIKSEVIIRFIGKISEEIVNRLNLIGLGERFEIIEYVKHKDAIKYMLTSNVLLLIIPDIKNNKGILTGKLFEYLVSKNPILLIGPTDGDAAKIINETKSGKICEYNDSTKISESITQMFYQSKQTNDRQNKTLADQYSRENLTNKLMTILEKI